MLISKHAHSADSYYRFKLFSIITQASLDIDIAGWFLNPQHEFVNKGSLVEAFVGQELISYGEANKPQQAFYWHKEAGPTNAEIDYLAQINHEVIPVEVKAGTGSTLRSMHHFLETHSTSPYGIRFSTQNYSVLGKIHSYPLYAIASVVAQADSAMREAVLSLAE